MTAWLAIAGGGAAGALLRYGMGNLLISMFGRTFPLGTLAVNVLGSLLIGVLYILMAERWALSEAWRLGMLVGVLGSFTTFSSFSLETLQLLEEAGAGPALLNILLNVVLCLAACWLGLWLARQYA